MMMMNRSISPSSSCCGCWFFFGLSFALRCSSVGTNLLLCAAFTPSHPHPPISSYSGKRKNVFTTTASSSSSSASALLRLSAYHQEYHFQLEFDAEGVGNEYDLPKKLTPQEEESLVRSMEDRLSTQFNRTFVLDRDSDAYMEQWFNVDVKGGFFVNMKRGGILVVRSSKKQEEASCLDNDLVITITPKHNGWLHSFSVSCMDPTTCCRITGAQTHAKGLQVAAAQCVWQREGSQSIAWIKTPPSQVKTEQGMPLYQLCPALEWRMLAGKRRFLFWTLSRPRRYYDFEVTLNHGEETPADSLFVAMEDTGNGYFCGWKDGSTLTVEGDPSKTIAILVHARKDLTLTALDVKCCYPDSGRCAGWQTGPIALDSHKVFNRSSDTLVFTSVFDNKQVKERDRVLSWNTCTESQSIRETLKDGGYSNLNVVD